MVFEVPAGELGGAADGTEGDVAAIEAGPRPSLEPLDFQGGDMTSPRVPPHVLAYWVLVGEDLSLDGGGQLVLQPHRFVSGELAGALHAAHMAATGASASRPPPTSSMVGTRRARAGPA